MRVSFGGFAATMAAATLASRLILAVRIDVSNSAMLPGGAAIYAAITRFCRIRHRDKQLNRALKSVGQLTIIVLFGPFPGYPAMAVGLPIATRSSVLSPVDRTRPPRLSAARLNLRGINNAMIWSLQILRFVAATMVVYVHAAQTARDSTGSIGMVPLELAVMGTAGVDIFFVLSGVVIAKTAPGMTSIEFLWRRLRRIFPIYFVACLLALPIAMTTGSGIGWRDLLATFLLWPATDVMTKPLLPLAWTLSFEMLFYVSAALALSDRRWLPFMGCLYGLAFALRSFGPVFQFLGNPLLVEFLFGIAIAYAPRMPRIGICLIPFGFIALAAVGLFHVAPKGETLDFLEGSENLQRVLVYGLPSALIVYGIMQIQAKESILTYLGGASYALYLFHPFALLPLQVLWMSLPIQPDLIVIVGMAASVLIAWRVHAVIESPILRAIPVFDQGRESASPCRLEASAQDGASTH